MKKLWAYILETRAGILSTTIIPVMLGSVIARRGGAVFKADIFFLTLAGFCLIHLGTNIINDYFDALDGTDNVNAGFIPPFSGGSRMLQKGRLSPREILAEGILLFLAAAAMLAAVSLKAGPSILWFLAGGLAAGIFYSAPPFKISRTGFGEILVAAVFGPLITLAAFMVQAGACSAVPVIISIPAGLLTAAFVIMAEFPDFEADRDTGKDNLVVRLGKKNGVILYAVVSIAAYAVIAAAALSGFVPKACGFAIFGSLFSVYAAVELYRKYETPGKLGLACALTLVSHMIAGAALIIAFII
jgi:1,4-dihydroxy-2-naphthoate octaprenyltransferase